jgi:hypothetical protein
MNFSFSSACERKNTVNILKGDALYLQQGVDDAPKLFQNDLI